MSKVQTLRGFINQRLSAAAEEIFELFERTIAEYEEQLCRSKEEKERQQKLLDAGNNPEFRLHRADIQQLLVSPENVPGEKEETGLSLDQEDLPDPPHIKEEQGELWNYQEMEQLRWLKEEEITEFPLTPVPLKNEEDGEEPLSSQLDENQTEELLHSESETDDSSYYLEESGKPQSGLNHFSDMECHTEETPVSFSECATNSGQRKQPQKQREIPQKEKPFCCSVCTRSFTTKGNLTQHMNCHLSEKPHICTVCGKRFVQKRYLKCHMVCHSGEKPFTCPVCGKSFAVQRSLRLHSFVHSGEKPYSCSHCGKRFVKSSQLKEHTAVHTKEKLFSCSLCDTRFSFRGALKRHAAVHTGEKPYSCNICEKSFARSDGLETHICVSRATDINET